MTDLKKAVEMFDALAALDFTSTETEAWLLIRKTLEDRTIALHTAIGMAQESELPSPDMYNRWREQLGWHSVDLSGRS